MGSPQILNELIKEVNRISKETKLFADALNNLEVGQKAEIPLGINLEKMQELVKKYNG